jgi:hypothetical protein
VLRDEEAEFLSKRKQRGENSMNSMYDCYTEWRRDGASPEEAAEKTARQYGFNLREEIDDVREKMVRLEDRERLSSSTKDAAA